MTVFFIFTRASEKFKMMWMRSRGVVQHKEAKVAHVLFCPIKKYSIIKINKKTREDG